MTFPKCHDIYKPTEAKARKIEISMLINFTWVFKYQACEMKKTNVQKEGKWVENEFSCEIAETTVERNLNFQWLPVSRFCPRFFSTCFQAKVVLDNVHMSHELNIVLRNWQNKWCYKWKLNKIEIFGFQIFISYRFFTSSAFSQEISQATPNLHKNILIFWFGIVKENLNGWKISEIVSEKWSNICENI